MIWTRDLTGEAEVNGQIRKSSQRSETDVEVRGIEVDVGQRRRWNGANRYTGRDRQATRVI